MNKNDSHKNDSIPKTKIIDNLKKISELGIKGSTSFNKKLIPGLSSSNRLSFPLKDNDIFLKSIDFPKLSVDDQFRKTNLSTRILRNICNAHIF